jgi:nucleoid-associated protein YgaU
MGMFSFIKEAGEKLFGTKEVEQAAASASPSLEELNTQAAHAVRDYIEAQKLGLTGLFVLFDGASGKVTVQGEAPTQEASEKVLLCCGNVAGVNSAVNDLLTVVELPHRRRRFHVVVSGDNLSKIAKAYYGDANKYPVIFEANKPMLSHPDKIYPGQALRIPPLA